MTETNTEKISILEQMAELGLSGDGFSEYQKAKALDLVFNAMRQTMVGKDKKYTYSIASNQIKKFLEKQFSKNYIEEIENFISLFDKLVDMNPWNGELKRLYRDRFKIRDSYLWCMDKRIYRLSQEKKARAQGGN